MLTWKSTISMMQTRTFHEVSTSTRCWSEGDSSQSTELGDGTGITASLAGCFFFTVFTVVSLAAGLSNQLYGQWSKQTEGIVLSFI